MKADEVKELRERYWRTFIFFHNSIFFLYSFESFGIYLIPIWILLILVHQNENRCLGRTLSKINNLSFILFSNICDPPPPPRSTKPVITVDFVKLRVMHNLKS